LFVRGNLTVNGSLTYTGNAVGDIVPASNNYSLGNTTSRWNMYATDIYVTGNTSANNILAINTVNAAAHTVGTSTVANATGVYTGIVNSATITTGNGFNGTVTGISINSSSFWIGNNSISSFVNSTAFSGFANNVTYVGSVTAANVVSNSQLSANLAKYALLAGANFTGGLSVANDVTITGNLIVSGTTLYANVTNLDVKDLNITVAKGAVTAAATDGAGITVDVANIGWYYNFAANSWMSNVAIIPSTNNALGIGTTAMRWGNIFANNLTTTTSVATGLVSASNVSATDIYGTVRTASQGSIDHDSLLNFVVNEHIDHSAVTLTAGNGLTGGGNITTSRSFSVVPNNGISVSASGVAAVGANGVSVTAAGINVQVGNNQLVSNSTGVWVAQGNINHDALANFVLNEHIDHTTVSITAGNGLTGGGDISATRSLAVVAGTGVVSNSTGVHANSTYIQSLVNISNGQVTTAGLTAQNVDTFAISTYFGAEYLVSVSDINANNKYVSKVLVMHDGSTAQITEYGSITSNSTVGVFSATQNATHVALQFTPALANTTVKYTRTVV